MATQTVHPTLLETSLSVKVSRRQRTHCTSDSSNPCKKVPRQTGFYPVVFLSYSSQARNTLAHGVDGRLEIRRVGCPSYAVLSHPYAPLFYAAVHVPYGWCPYLVVLVVCVIHTSRDSGQDSIKRLPLPPLLVRYSTTPALQ